MNERVRVNAETKKIIQQLKRKPEPDYDPVEKHATLTPREVQVADQMMKGLSDREIAKVLGCSHATVGQHRKSIYRRVGASDRDTCLIKLVDYFQEKQVKL